MITELMSLSIREIIATIFLLVGLVFVAISAIGVVRLPDFYSRLHASGIGETLGLMISFIGLAIYEGLNILTVKLFIVFLLVFLANPIGTHILGKSAYKNGLPWELKKKKGENDHADTHH